MLHLTVSQHSAVESFTRFLGGDSQVFMLKGSAGTGKTTLLKEYLSILESKQFLGMESRLLKNVN